LKTLFLSASNLFLSLASTRNHNLLCFSSINSLKPSTVFYFCGSIWQWYFYTIAKNLSVILAILSFPKHFAKTSGKPQLIPPVKAPTEATTPGIPKGNPKSSTNPQKHHPS